MTLPQRHAVPRRGIPSSREFDAGAGLAVCDAFLNSAKVVSGQRVTLVAVVRSVGGSPAYQYDVKTSKGQTGVLSIEASCNDGVTVLLKTLPLE